MNSKYQLLTLCNVSTIDGVNLKKIKMFLLIYASF